MKPDRKRPVDIEAAATLALTALAFLAEDQNRLEHFLAETGMNIGELKANATSPTFLAAILDYVLHDEPLLLVFSSSRGIEPDSIYPSHTLLTEAALRETHT